MKLKSKTIHFSALIIPLLFSSALRAQNEDKISLGKDDTSGNTYIESALKEVPPTPPEANIHFLQNKKKLAQQKDAAESNITPKLPEKVSTDGLPLPKVETVSAPHKRSPEELLETLSKQTGLGKEEIIDLFNGKKVKPHKAPSPVAKEAQATQ